MGQFCADAGFVLRIIVKVVKILRWVIPILLIVLVSFDLFKVVSGQVDDKAKKEATSKAVKRVLYALIIFFIPTIVNLVLGQMSTISTEDNLTTNSSTWYECWLGYYNEN